MYSSPPIFKMDGRQGALLCLLLLLGFSVNEAQHRNRDPSNVVFTVPGAADSHTRTQQRPQEANLVNSPRGGAARPASDSDGAIYQKTVNGVSFKIVTMCQNFDTLFKPGMMEFDTLQSGCRFVITFDKNLPASQTVYTPSSIYSTSSAVANPYYSNQVSEQRRDFYSAPQDVVADPAPSRYLKPVTTVVREPAYQVRQQYPQPRQPPPRQPPPRQQAPRQQAPRRQAPRQQAPRQQAPRPQAPRQQAPRQQTTRQQAPRQQAPRQQAQRQQAPRDYHYSQRAPQPQESQYATRAALPSQRNPAPPTRTIRYVSVPTRTIRVQPQRVQTRYEVHSPSNAQSGPIPTDKKKLNRLQLEALGLGSLHGHNSPTAPVVTVSVTPPTEAAPIPRI